MMFRDSNLKKYRLMIAFMVLLIGIVLMRAGYDGTVPVLVGAAGTLIVVDIFGGKRP